MVKGVLSWLVTLVLIGVIFSGQSTAEDDCSCPDGCPVEIIIFMEQRGTFQEPGEGSQVVCNVYVNFTVFYVWSANTSTKFLERVKKNLNETAHEWYNNTGPSGEYNNCNKEWEVYTEDNNGNEVVLGINSNKELYLFCLTIEDTTVTVGAASVYKGNLDQYNPPCEANEFDITASLTSKDGSKTCTYTVTITGTAIVPEPLTILMATIGVLSVLGFTYKRREFKL